MKEEESMFHGCLAGGLSLYFVCFQNCASSSLVGKTFWR